MPVLDDYLTVNEAAEELGLTASGIRRAIMRGHIEPKRLGKRANLVPRAQVDEYRAKHLGQWGRGKRKKAATEPQE
jgi:excisionase family DNA binding protein